MNKAKVAIVHDWLTGMRGGEKCLEVLCELFPRADLYTLVHKKGSVSLLIENMNIRTSFLQSVPTVFKNYRLFLPLFPRAIESFNLERYDIVISSSHCVAKGAKTLPGTLNICYCYTPMRYAWKFFDEYFLNENPVKKWFISRIITRLKRWDIQTNRRVDYFIAISDNVKKRIKEFYKRDADVIYPPLDIDSSASEAASFDNGYYLIVSALVPYKRIDLAIKAFNKTGRKLVLVGDGPDLDKLKNMAGNNIEFLGWVSDMELKRHYSACRALIFPGEEDFGIVPLEAQAFGKPVIAYGSGGVLETVVPLGESGSLTDDKIPSGVFFYEQNTSALNFAVEKFENNRNIFDADRIRRGVLRFNRHRFKEEMTRYIADRWKKHAGAK